MRGRRLRPAADPHGMSLTTRFSVSAMKDQRLKIHTCCAAAQVMQAQGGSQQCHQAVSTWGSAPSPCPVGTGWGPGAGTGTVQLLTPKCLEEGVMGWPRGTVQPPGQLQLSAGPHVTHAQLDGHNI